MKTRLTMILMLSLLVACGSDEKKSGSPDGLNLDGFLGDVRGSVDAFEELGAKDTVEADETSSAPCTDGQRACSSMKEISQCQGGVWSVVAVCPDTHMCSGGQCAKLAECEPGTISGCATLSAINKCNEQGTAFVPEQCPEGMSCIGGSGVCTNNVCFPGQAMCTTSTSIQSCKSDGSGWSEPEECPEGLTCVGGKCMSQCLYDPKWANSYIGCEYWSVDLDNYHDAASASIGGVYPDEAKHGIVLGNPGTAPAIVTFTFPAGVAYIIPEITLQPGEVKDIPFPRMDIDGSGIFDKVVRINSNRPVVAYQYNPLDFQGAYSDDSSLLIPAEMLGYEYFAMTLPTAPLEAMPMIPAPSQHGYFTIVAVEEGTTKVSVKVTAVADHPQPNLGQALMQPGSYVEFTLQQFQVLSLQADGSKFTTKTDLTGSHVIADKRVAVFSGHEEAVVTPPGSAPPESSGCCCAEHLEDQMFPIDTWANRYLCVKAPSRGAPDQDLWRVLAGQAGVTITTNPPIDGLNGKTLANKGDWIEVYTDLSFVLDASGPVQVAQYLASRDCNQDFIGDPSLIMGVAESQYRSDYHFLVPKDYTKDYVTIIRKAGTNVLLDGVELGDGEFMPLADSGYEYAWLLVEDGPHSVEGEEPMGAFQYGYHNAASYGHPAGLNLVREDTE